MFVSVGGHVFVRVLRSGRHMFVCMCTLCADAHVLNVAGVCVCVWGGDGGGVCLWTEPGYMRGGGENVRVRQRYFLCIYLIDLF